MSEANGTGTTTTLTMKMTHTLKHTATPGGREIESTTSGEMNKAIGTVRFGHASYAMRCIVGGLQSVGWLRGPAPSLDHHQ